MLDRLLGLDGMPLALAQAGAAALLVLAVLALARRQGVRLFGEATWAMLRGFVQVLAVGAALAWILDGPAWTGALVLFGMLAVAASIARNRATSVPDGYRIAFLSLLIGAGGPIALLLALGVIELDVAAMVPIGSMILSNAMTAVSLLMERIRADLASGREIVETALALGATPAQAVAPQVEQAVRAAMTPQVNTMTALGVVFIPGLMSGMILAGADPVLAAVRQFVIIAVILAAGGLSAMVAAVLTRRALFTAADQLRVPAER